MKIETTKSLSSQNKSSSIQTSTQNANNNNKNNNNNIEEIVMALLEKLNNVQHTSNNTNQPNNKVQTHQNNDSVFIIKSGMKASYVASRVENILLLKRAAVMTALGFAIPVLVDSVLLVKKDLEKQGRKVLVNIELFEKQVTNPGNPGKSKIISGVRVTLTLQQ